MIINTNILSVDVLSGVVRIVIMGLGGLMEIEDILPDRKIIFLPPDSSILYDTEYKRHKKMNQDIGFNQCLDLIVRRVNGD